MYIYIYIYIYILYIYIYMNIHITSTQTIYYVLSAVFASYFYVLLKFYFTRGVAQGSPLVNPLK